MPTRDELEAELQEINQRLNIRVDAGTDEVISTPAGDGITSPSDAAISRQFATDPLTGSAIGPGFMEDEAGQTVGGVGGGMVGASRGAAMAPPHPAAKALGAILGGAVGAFGGGSAGESGQQIAQRMTNSPLAPESAMQALTEIAVAGGEEAVLDAVGGVFFTAGSAALRGVARKTATSLGAEKRLPMTEELQGILERGGGSMPLSAVLDSRMIDTVEEIARGGIVGGPRFTSLDAINEETIVGYTQKFVNDFAGTASDVLTDEGIGRLFVNTVDAGISAHSLAVGGLYEELDRLVPPVDRLVRVPNSMTAILSGAPSIKTMLVKQGPVDLREASTIAKAELRKLAMIKDVGKTKRGGALLEQIAKQESNVLFSNAHFLRSNLLAIKRDLTQKQALGPIGESLTAAVKSIDNAMDTAGAALSPEGIAAYRATNELWRTGKARLQGQLVAALLSKRNAPTKIGDAIFRRGNEDEIKAVKAAIEEATRYSKEVDFDVVWRKMQSGYLRNLMPTDPSQLSSAPLSKIIKDRKVRRTFMAVFTKEQRDSIKKLASMVDVIASSPGKRTGIGLRQLGAFGTLAGTAGIAGGAGTDMGAMNVTNWLLLPEAFAFAATRPGMVRAIASLYRHGTATHVKKVAAMKIAAGMLEYGKEQREKEQGIADAALLGADQ